MMFKFRSSVLLCLTLIFAGQVDAQFVKQTEIPLTPTPDYSHGIAFDGGNWHIANLNTPSFNTYNSSFSRISQITIPGLVDVRGLAFDSSTGNLWLGDYTSSRVYEVTTTGTLIQDFPVGTGVNAVAYNPLTDTIWVARFASELQQWSRTGTLISSFSTPGLTWTGLAMDSCSGNLLLMEAQNDLVYEYQTDGTQVGQIIPSDQIIANGQGLYYDAATAELYATSAIDPIITVFQDPNRTTCGAPSATYSVGGTVSGLTGTGLALQNNGGDTLAVAAAATAFTFSTELLDLAAYGVTVSAQPTGQTCTVTNGSGAIAAANVTDVVVTCVDDGTLTFSNVSYTATSVTFTIDGDMSGYVAPVNRDQFFSLRYGGDIWASSGSSSGNTWSRSAFDNKALYLDGSTGDFISGTYTWSSYAISPAVDTLADATVDNATVTLSFSVALLNMAASSPTITFVWGGGGNGEAPTILATVTPSAGAPPSTYTVGGTVSGLTGTGLALQNNAADTLAVAADGLFTFVTELVDSTAYAVTVSTQPTGQTCSVTNGSGTIATADVTNVAVTCVDDVVVVPPTPAAPIPTLSQWALIMLSMFLGLMVFANRRRLF